MAEIWKFPLAVVSVNSLDMPKGAEILTVQTQGDIPCLWAMVDPDAEQERRYVEILGTGQPIFKADGCERRYIGTFQQRPFVWHVFERLS